MQHALDAEALLQPIDTERMGGVQRGADQRLTVGQAGDVFDAVAVHVMSANTTGDTPVMNTRSRPPRSAAPLTALNRILMAPSPPTSSW